MHDEMLHFLPEVVDIMAHKQEDSIRMIHHIRPQHHGKKFSRFQQIIQSIFISILVSVLSFNLRQVDEMSVSVQRLLKVDSKYGLVPPPIHLYTFVDRIMSVWDLVLLEFSKQEMRIVHFEMSPSSLLLQDILILLWDIVLFVLLV